MPNVVTSAAPDERVRVFWNLLDEVAANLDATADESRQKVIKQFLLEVAWHEGAKLRTRVQGGGGPARGFFQFEAHRAKDGCAYADSKNLLGFLATSGNTTEPELIAAFNALPDFDPDDPSASAIFPEGNLIGDTLATVDLFGVYLARICFKKVPAAIPDTPSSQADYWYQFWKISGGDAVALKATFVQECIEVAGFLPE